MSDKSVQKRQYIIEKARTVFMEKGYKTVTMKDIVEACEISRGGLYLYFSSVAEIFEEVLKEEGATEDSFEDGIPKDASASTVLALFMKEQKREILNKKISLTVAIYEYYFNTRVKGRDNYLKRQFDMALFILEKLITEGVATGELYCENPHGMASNIMYVLEGLKVAARTRGIQEATVDREILYVMQGLIPEE